ncbi:MAG TPA: hypothetical protein VN851_15510 [Thermoanaerobaculia bacterium]|nr:hypothetical protein [Thermoanaerobaculia bacterium]
METRSEKAPLTTNAVTPAKRARLDALLFNDAAPTKGFVGPKLPPMQGE